MLILVRNYTELCNILYGDNEDYSYIDSSESLSSLFDNYIEYFEQIEEEIQCSERLIQYDTGYIGDMINIIQELKKSVEVGSVIDVANKLLGRSEE